MRLCVNCSVKFDATGWTCPACGFAPSVVDGVPILAPALAGGNASDATYAYDEVFAAESQHFWFINRNELIAWAIARYFPEVRSFFDMGCGTGGLVKALHRALPSVHLAAGDAHVSGLAFARLQAPDVSFVQLDIRQLPYDGEFDVIGVFDVLEHLDDDELALRELHRAIAPRGGLIVTVPQHRFLWSALDDHSRHRRRYARRDLCEKLVSAGYTIERVTSFMTLTLPAQFASRLRQQDRATLDASAELRSNPVLNRLFGRMCAVERIAIAAGVSFPVGGSLLVVARKA